MLICCRNVVENLSVLNILDGERKKIILLAGDFNLDLIKHDTHINRRVLEQHGVTHFISHNNTFH